MKKWLEISILSLMCFHTLQAKPSGVDIKHGKISLHHHEENLHINQHTKYAIIHWKDFSINEGELTEFHLENSGGATLNRVTGSQMSKLMGTLRSNGKVYLINPNGILVGPKGVIETTGTVLSTLDLSDSAFLEDRELWFKGDSHEGIVNLGRIETLTGDIFLLAAKVQNDGTLQAPQGTVGLASANEIYLMPAGHERLVIKASAHDGLLENTGKIEANFVEMQSVKENPYALAINTTGTISATQVEKRGGKILLRATGGSIAANGNLSAPEGDISLYADNIAVAGTLSVSGVEAGGNILVLASDTASLTGELLADGKKQGGNIEFSGGKVELNGTVRAAGEIAGKFLLDPYNVWLATTPATRPTVDWSWVDVSSGSTLITTLDSGTDVTLTTTSNSGYDLTGSALLDGDMIVDEMVMWSGNGSLSLNSSRDLQVEAPIVTSGTGAVTLNAGRDFILDPTLGRVQTAGGNIYVSSGTVDTTGSLTAYTTAGAMIFDALTGDVSLSSVGTGDITMAGRVQSTNFSFNAPTASIWIGNYSTGTLSNGSVTAFEGDDTGTLTALGASVTFCGGAGTNEFVMALKEQVNVQSFSGDVVVTGGSGLNAGVDLRAQSGISTHTYQAAGNLRFLGGSNGGTVNIGNAGIGNAQGNVQLEAGINLDILAGQESSVDIRSGGGLFPDIIKVGTTGLGNLTITASNAAAILYLGQGSTSTPGTYSIANNLTVTGGTGIGGGNLAAHVLISNAGGLSVGSGVGGGDLIIQARDQDNGHAFFDMSANIPVAYNIGGDVQVLAGSGLNTIAECYMTTPGGGTHNIVGGILIKSGTAEGTLATLRTGNSIVSVQEDVQIIAQNAAAGYFFGDIDNSMSELLVSGGLSVIAGSSADGYASATLDGEGSFYSEVVNNVLVQGGTSANATAEISLFATAPIAEQTIYVGGAVNCLGGSAENTSATINVLSFGTPIVQSLEAGQDITFIGGSGNGALAGIRNGGLYDPTGAFFGIPIDSPGPTLNIQSLGNITCQNGTGYQAYAIMGTDGTLLLPDFPLIQFISGSVIAQAGGDINVSAPLNKNQIGPVNSNHQIVLFANRQFTPGSLWPTNTLLGVSGPSLYPSGLGALTFDTGTFNTNTLLATNLGNISLLSAPLDSSGITPVDFIDGSQPNEALLSTNSGNVFILGFRDITLDAPLTTLGNNSLVPSALFNIQIQANEALTVNQPIALPTANYSIGIGTASVANDPVTLNASVTANSNSGLVAVINNSGPITQTVGTVTGHTVNLSAAQGISGPIPTINALSTSATIVNATNSFSGNLSLLNNLAGTRGAYTQATLSNGLGGSFNNRSLTFIQIGGSSLSLASAACDGDILAGAFSGVGNLSIDGNVRPGRHLMGVGYGDLVLTSNGRIQGVENVTLICDEAYPHNTGPGWFRNLSTVGGVTTEALDQNIAVYASSGPLANALNPPLQVILGNLSSDATWDAGLPGGLDSKYATSYQNGGPYHGPGFGVDYTPGNGVFGSSVIWYKYPMPPFPPPVPPTPPVPPHPPHPPAPPVHLPYHKIAQAAFAIQGLTLQIWEMRLIRYIEFSLLWQPHAGCVYPLYHYGIPIPFKTDPPRVNDSYERATYALHSTI